MLSITIDDLKTLFSDGAKFEVFAQDLIMLEMLRHGLLLPLCWYDHQSNRRDGGMDFVIEEAHGNEKSLLIPNAPVIFSFKSGQGSGSVSEFKKEVLGNKKTNRNILKEKLKTGYHFVWVAPLSLGQLEKNKYIEAKNEVAKVLGVNSSVFHFVWIETLLVIAKKNPNLVKRHFPSAIAMNSRLSLRSYSEWEKRDRWGSEKNWIDFSNRSEIKKEIAQHLTSKNKNNIKHIAGLSGIGKTRLVREACNDPNGLCDVLYLEEFDEDEFRGDGLISYLEREIDIQVRLVIDEISMENYEKIKDRLKDKKFLRIITIGPISNKDADRERKDTLSLVCLRKPGRDDVKVVLKGSCPALSDSSIDNNVSHCAHDLRLALMLAEAMERNPEDNSLPIRNTRELFDRIISNLFSSNITNPHEFRKHYQLFSTALEIGIKEQYKGEIEYLCDYYEYKLSEVRSSYEKAVDCGLGEKTPSYFFEAGPMALANMMFEEETWGCIKDDLDGLLNNMPERLKKSFLKRCQYCSSDIRPEVEEAISSFFYKTIRERAPSSLSDTETARNFQLWIETAPETGLPWLKQYLNDLNDDEIIQLGDSDVFDTGSGGRRYLVWTLSHLAIFNEYFHDAEEGLFRLAQVETENAISNNSTYEWSCLFLPALSFCETPFADRLEVYIKRLKEISTNSQAQLILSMIRNILKIPGGRMLPPDTIGGRIRPKSTDASSREELIKYHQMAGHEILLAIETLSDEYKTHAGDKLIDNIISFTRIGTLPNLKKFIDSLSVEDETWHLKLDIKINRALEVFSNIEDRKTDVQLLNEWLTEIHEKDPLWNIKMLTAQFPWNQRKAGKEIGDEYIDQVYGEAAKDILKDLTLLDKLCDWIETNGSASAGTLGMALAKIDSEKKVERKILEFLKGGRGYPLVRGFIRGVSGSKMKLSESWREELKKQIKTHPRQVCEIVLESDVSSLGLKIFFEAVGTVSTNSIQLYYGFVFNWWKQVLNKEEQHLIFRELLSCIVESDNGETEVAFSLASHWYDCGDRDIPFDILFEFVGLVEKKGLRVEAYRWKNVLSLLGKKDPHRTCRSLVRIITDVKGNRNLNLVETSEGIFAEVAVDNQVIAMKEIGKCLLEKERKSGFAILVHRGLFSNLSKDVVNAWIEQHGREYMYYIARHLPPPHITNERLDVPPLTMWFFENCPNEEAFNSFLAGIRSFEFRGPAMGYMDDLTRLKNQLNNQQLHKWVRNWIKYEIDSINSDIEFERSHHDEVNRSY